MESNTVTSFRPRNSPSSQRFLASFSSHQSQTQNPNGNVNGSSAYRTTSTIGDEFNEDDVFWTGNFSQTDHKSENSSSIKSDQNYKPSSFRRVDSSGILAALPGDDDNRRKPLTENRLLYRKISFPSSSTSPSSSRMIPAIPKTQISHDRDQFISVSTGNNYRHSAPVNVPVRPRVKERETVICESDDDDDEGDEMLPPHEIVARGSSQSEMTFSVLEGIGRTLKGRDLRQVRNAVWRQTGFLD
ncbi:hypothetical protein ACHQM5_021098 [Ranunculus cassubicifolius]